MSRKSSEQERNYTQSRLSPQEKIFAYGLALAVILTLIALVLFPRAMPAGTLAIVRFLASFASGLSAYLFLGEVQVRGKIKKMAVRASGGFALFILVFILFYKGVSSDGESEIIGIDITLYNNQVPYKKAIAILNSCPSKTFNISYNASYNSSSILEIEPQTEYLSLFKQDPSSLDLSEFCDFWFDNEFPKLSVKAVNNTSKTLFLTEAIAEVEVIKERDDTPILKLSSNFYQPNQFKIINDGWGDVINPIVDVNFSKIQSCFETTRADTIRKEVFKPGDFSKEITIEIENENSVAQSILSLMQEKSGYCANVNVKYSDIHGVEYSNKLKTILWLKEADPPLVENSLKLPTGRYSLHLNPDERFSKISIPLSHYINPGDVDNFIIEAFSRRTVRFSISFLFKTADGIELKVESMILNLFVPRSVSSLCNKNDAVYLLSRAVKNSLFDKELIEPYFDKNRNTNIHNLVYEALMENIKKEIPDLSTIEKLNLSWSESYEFERKYSHQIESYVRNYVSSHNIYFCEENNRYRRNWF